MKNGELDTDRAIKYRGKCILMKLPSYHVFRRKYYDVYKYLVYNGNFNKTKTQLLSKFNILSSKCVLLQLCCLQKYNIKSDSSVLFFENIQTFVL